MQLVSVFALLIYLFQIVALSGKICFPALFIQKLRLMCLYTIISYLKFVLDFILRLQFAYLFISDCWCSWRFQIDTRHTSG